jgi:hypothetical protein
MNGLFSQAIANRNKKPKIHFTKGLYAAAIEELRRDLEEVTTGGESEASSDPKDQAASFKAAISLLEKQ